MERKNVVFHPIIGSIQKIALYETKSKYYLLGSNNTETRFRVLKIDRLEPRDLFIYDDKVEYTQDEIHDLINMIESGNRQRGVGSSFSKVISAFGIVGFIRFLEGYYIILITKRRRVAVVGHHSIYKIEDTTMIYIPHESVRLLNPDEPRYVKMFQNIDLSSNFYFSYSYDLTHTLQYNLSYPKRFIPSGLSEDECEDFSLPLSCDSLENCLINSTSNDELQNYGIRIKPHEKFIWNTHLLSNVIKDLHPDWLLYITHGFVGQSNMNVFGRSVYVTLIARRSSKYAGTRFLKRGANFQGDVANEVETEQMVHDSGVSSFSQGHYTSFVQMRGSIPGHWKQDMGKMVAKPAIAIDLFDPYAETASAHFNELLKRYGAPVIILNLVKQRERKKQERLLSEEMSAAVRYLNQFLPQEHQIVYKTFDMARKNKSTSVNVMRRLAGIARSGVLKTGIFHNQPQYYSQKGNTIVGQQRSSNTQGSLQTGIIRTNCVDCLDRTNTAQFAIGKCVLGFQLCALGILDNPTLEFDTDCVRMLESLYEDHGDTLALQYGGSQLVHRVKTYRKTAPWTSHGNDIMQTLSRYYSNTFSDAEKQNTINLFLGIFVPEENKPQIWDFNTDYYFHHKYVIDIDKSLTQWYESDVLKCLPYAYNELTKACTEIIQMQTRDVEMIDAYIDYHRPYELSVLNEVFAYAICNSIRDFMPNFTINYSPFTIRVRPVRRREEVASKKGVSMKNPSLTGQSSVSSTASSSSSSSNEDSSFEDLSLSNTNDSSMSVSRENTTKKFTFHSLFPTMKEVYGTELKPLSRDDKLLYKRYVLIGKKANGTVVNSFMPVTANLRMESDFSKDTSLEVTPPKVSRESIEIYKRYIETGIRGGFAPKAADLAIYEKYASFK